jgi:uncharacterized protein (DUF433 family)
VVWRSDAWGISLLKTVEMRHNIRDYWLMGKTAQIAWDECDLVERVNGKCGGRPVIKRTRIEPDLIPVEEEYGRTPEQTHEDFPTLPVETIMKLRAFAHQHQLTH